MRHMFSNNQFYCYVSQKYKLHQHSIQKKFFFELYLNRKKSKLKHFVILKCKQLTFSLFQYVPILHSINTSKIQASEDCTGIQNTH